METDNQRSLIELTPEYINSLPVLSFKGPIHLVRSKSELDSAIGVLQKEPAVGFDTESRPSFVKGRNYPISLIQLATPSEAFIIQLRTTGFTDSLKEFFELAVEKIGVGVKDDLRKLKQERDFLPHSMIDLSEIAKMKGHLKSSLRVLSARYLEHKIVKSAQKTNWSRFNLTETQLRYAATDAWACLLIRPLLEKE